MDILNKLASLEREAATFGFKWENATQIMQQILSECAEVNTHIEDNDQKKLQEEIGDLLHAVFSLCIFCQFDPKDTLTQSIHKFEQRFRAVQSLAYKQGLKSLNGKSFEELMEFWSQAKKANI